MELNIDNIINFPKKSSTPLAVGHFEFQYLGCVKKYVIKYTGEILKHSVFLYSSEYVEQKKPSDGT